MQIEYKIKFDKDGLTVTQTITPNSVPVPVANGQVKELTAAPGADVVNPLTKVSNDVASGGPDNSSQDDTNGPPPSQQAPIFVLGPIVFSGAAQANSVPQANAAVQPKAAPVDEPNDKQTKAPKAKAAGRGREA
jgi:hypothetical protein